MRTGSPDLNAQTLEVLFDIVRWHIVPIFLRDLGHLKAQLLFFPLHKLSDPKSLDSDSLGNDEINDLRHRRWSSVVLAGETSLTTLSSRLSLTSRGRPGCKACGAKS
jgi:hypothetical protein